MSNRRKAMEIFSSNPNATRKNVIEMFKAQLGIADNTASTYYHHCKKSVPMVKKTSQEVLPKEVVIVPSKVVTENAPYDYGEDFVVPAFLVKSYQRLGWID